MAPFEEVGPGRCLGLLSAVCCEAAVVTSLVSSALPPELRDDVHHAEVQHDLLGKQKFMDVVSCFWLCSADPGLQQSYRECCNLLACLFVTVSVFATISSLGCVWDELQPRHTLHFCSNSLQATTITLALYSQIILHKSVTVELWGR